MTWSHFSVCEIEKKVIALICFHDILSCMQKYHVPAPQNLSILLIAPLEN